jgi:hypothetical protein
MQRPNCCLDALWGFGKKLSGKTTWTLPAPLNVIAAVVERVSELRFVDYLRANVLPPAGMDYISDDDHFRIIRHPSLLAAL